MSYSFKHETEDNHLMRRKSMFGETRLYAPDTDPSTWGSQGWLLRTEHGTFRMGQTHEGRHEAGICVLVKASEAVRLFENTHQLTPADIWIDVDAEVERVL